MIPSSAEMESLRTLRNGRMVMRTHHLKNHMSTRVIYPLHAEKVTNYCLNLAHKGIRQRSSPLLLEIHCPANSSSNLLQEELDCRSRFCRVVDTGTFLNFIQSISLPLNLMVRITYP